jgi:hypothetical protein
VSKAAPRGRSDRRQHPDYFPRPLRSVPVIAQQYPMARFDTEIGVRRMAIDCPSKRRGLASERGIIAPKKEVYVGTLGWNFDHHLNARVIR